MIVKYNSSVKTAAGWRSVSLLAEVERVSEKTARVTRVLEIDGAVPAFSMSRTGAKRQGYNGLFFAGAEVGKRKFLSSCEIVDCKK